MRRECQERFPRPAPRESDPDIHHGTCVRHMPWCMPGSINSGFLWSRWRGKRSRHSRRMRIPQFYVSGKRPMNRNRPTPTVGNLEICIGTDNKYHTCRKRKLLIIRKKIAGKDKDKEGGRIQNIKTLHNVEINTTETGQDQRSFTIWGAPKNATKLQRVLREIVNENEEKDIGQ